MTTISMPGLTANEVSLASGAGSGISSHIQPCLSISRADAATSICTDLTVWHLSVISPADVSFAVREGIFFEVAE